MLSLMLTLFLLQPACPGGAAVSPPSSSPAAVYASPSQPCSDTGPGTKEQPLCSIAAAVAAVRGTNRAVLLRGGTFALNSTIHLTVADAGLTLVAADGERPLISGGIAVPGWATASTPGVWAAPYPKAASSRSASTPRQLYVNGRRANRTSANASVLLGDMAIVAGSNAPIQTPAGMQPSHAAGGGGGGGSYRVSKPAMKGWQNPRELEFVYPAQIEPWTEPRCGITGISADGLEVSMEPCLAKLPVKAGATRRWFMSGLPSIIENAAELLSPHKPGEFYIDQARGEIRYVPHADEDMRHAIVVLPLLESLLLSHGATDLTLDGIDFAHTAWTGPDTPCGYIPTQAGWHEMSDHCQAAQSATQTATAVHTNTNADFDSDRTAHTTVPVPVPGPSRYVMGAGGLPMISSNSSTAPQASLVSQSGRAVLTMQGDANLCSWAWRNTSCMHAGCARQNVFCIGKPVCPCAPKCSGAQKHPPYCNQPSPAGYELVIHTGSDGNVCIVDIAAGTTRWCARSVSAPVGDYHLLLGDDGSTCIHSGRYGTHNAQNTSLWCAPMPSPGDATPLRRIPAGVVFNKTTGTTITNCSFSQMGGAGLDLYGGSQHNHISSCYAYDISGSAMQIGGVEPCPACPTCGIAKNGSVNPDGLCPTTLPSPELDLNNSILDSVFADVTREFHGCLGVWAGYNRQFEFGHNEICRVAYGGLSLGWGWAIPWQNTYQRENEIHHNHITHWMGVLDDSGATYTLGPHMNSTHHHNYAAHAGEIGIVSGGPTGPSGSGIEPGDSHHGGAWYPDDGSAFWHIHQNVAEDLHGGEWLFAWNAADEHDLYVDGNWADTTTHVCATATCHISGNTFVNRSTEPPTPWPPAALAVMKAAGVRAGRRHPDAVGACHG